MKYSSRGIVIAVLSLLLLSCVGRPVLTTQGAEDPVYADAISEAREVVAPLAAGGDGISVAVGVAGELVWSEGFGRQARQAGAAVTPLTRFRVYSVMKQFTGLLALQMALRGEVDLSAPVHESLPELPRHYEAVTLQQLLQHRAGVRHYREAAEALMQRHCARADQALDLFVDDPLIDTPGAMEHYSSFGFVLASAVLEAQAGMPFPELLRQRLLLPASATDTGLENPGQDQSVVTFYDRDSSGEVRRSPASDNSCKMGAGGFLSTAEDIVRLHNAVLGEAVVPLPAVRQMLGGRSRLEATGSASGGLAVSVIDLEEQISVVLLSNTGSPANAHKLLTVRETLYELFSKHEQ